MRNKTFNSLMAAAAIAAMPAAGHAQVWTTWNSGSCATANGSTPGIFSGTLGGLAVTYTGNCASGSQLSSGGINYWSPTGAYTQGGLTAPDNVGFIQFDEPVTNGKLTFNGPVVDPYIAFISVGQGGRPVSFTFNAPFTVLSNNNTACAYWGCGSYTLGANSFSATEFSGTVQFTGTYSELDFTTHNEEYWYGLTVGTDHNASVTPEPATMTLLGTGLVALAGAGRRRRKRVS